MPATGQRRASVAAVLVALVTVGGCSTAPAVTPVPTPAVTVTPAGPRPSPGSPEATDWRGARLVSGTLAWEVRNVEVTTHGDGSSHVRGATLRETLTSDDPRVSGVVTGTWNSVRWGSSGDGALVQWGTAVLRNSGGSWEGRYSGAYTSRTGDMITWWYVGRGGYEGLTLHMWVTDGYSLNWQGLLYRGDPPVLPAP